MKPGELIAAVPLVTDGWTFAAFALLAVLGLLWRRR